MIVKVTLPETGSPREYAFHRKEALIGSGRRNDLRIPLPNVAPRHARLRRDGDRVWLEPLRSGLAVAVERAQGGRIKVSGAIVLHPGDRVLLGSDDERASIELVSVDSSTPCPSGDTLFRIDDAEGSAPPPLLEAVTDFAVDISSVTRPAELREVLDQLAQHFTVDAEVPSGIVLFGGNRRPPRWWLPNELATRLRGDGALMTGADWRRDVRARLNRGEVLRSHGGEKQPSLVVVPLHGESGAAGAWLFSSRRPVAIDALEAVAGMVSELVTSALERLSTAVELDALREENRYFRGRERRHYLYKELVTESPAMRAVYETVHELLEAPGPIWIVGEKGSGKEMVARALHHLSSRAESLLISLACSAMTEDELDVELFGRITTPTGDQAESEAAADRAGTGHIKRPGLLELCHGGTLFLEGIEHLSPRLQTRLSRAIQEREVRPEGASIGRSVDVCLVLASERDLSVLVENGQFRKDLYLQLVAHPVRLPPLRERTDDIVPLANVFVSSLAPRYRKAASRVASSLHDTLKSYDWPGNVRELQGYIEAAVIAAPADAEAIEMVPGLAAAASARPGGGDDDGDDGNR